MRADREKYETKETLTVEDRLESLGEQTTHRDGQTATPVA